METKQNKTLFFSALSIAIGLVVAGMFLYCGIKSISENSRIVSVRGLAEMDVNADHVTWSLPFTELGNDLPSLYEGIGKKRESIKEFLLKNGIKNEEISVSAPRISDGFTESYRTGNSSSRYRITSIIVVSSYQVDLVRSLISRQEELLKQGIAVMTGEWGEYRPEYSFTKLNDIKPKMIEEATKNARHSAEKFATDSQSRLGNIKTASQGLFSIEDSDNNTPWLKHVRVVTSMEYLLKD